MAHPQPRREEALEQVLARLGKPGDDGFFAQKAVTKTLDSLRGGQMATTAGKVSDYFKSMLGTFEMLMKQAGSGAPEIPFDELGKLLDVPLIMVDKTWLEDTHFEYRIRIAPPGE